MKKPRKEEIATVTPDQLEDEEKKLEDLSEESPVKGVKNAECPVCGELAWSYSNDLTYETHRQGERIVVTNLRGLRCRNCGDQAYDPRSSRIIESVLKERVPGGYECTITNLGGKRLGIYLPKDVIRELDVEPKQKAIIKLLSRKKMVIEI